MNRRSILKALFLGRPTSAPLVVEGPAIAGLDANDMGISDKRWHVLSGRDGRQDLSPGKLIMNWRIENDRLTCMAHLPDSTVFLSDYLLSVEGKSFKAEMLFTFHNQLVDQADELNVGFRFSPSMRSTDSDIDVGISGDGSLFIGQTKGEKVLKEEILKEPLRLVLTVISQSAGGCFAKLKAFDRSGNTLATLSSTKYASSEWQGSIGVLSSFTGTIISDMPSIVISKFRIEGEKLIEIKLQPEDTDYIN